MYTKPKIQIYSVMHFMRERDIYDLLLLQKKRKTKEKVKN